jgi:hypothetical protein
MARPPMAATNDSLKAFYYPASNDQSLFSCEPAKESVVQIVNRFLKDKNYISKPVRTEPPCAASFSPHNASHAPSVLLVLINHFLSWLDDAAGKRKIDDCLDWLLANGEGILPDGTTVAEAAKKLVRHADWSAVRRSVGDSLIAAVVGGMPVVHIDYLTRLFRVIAFIEAVAAESLPVRDEASVADTVNNRFVLLPPWVQTARWEISGRTDIPLFARAPAFSDLVVVREEWSCYAASEIAHIENIMKGEKKLRTHERMEETETREEGETTTTNYDERDTQTTERQSLKEEASKETSLEIGVDGQVDTSGQYGPTRVNTHIGARLNYSVHESRQRSSEYAKEIVDRAISKVETKVREFRSTRALIRNTERNEHSFDNAGGGGHVIGIYRWVDRIIRLQTFRYKHRFLLEFEIPEPGAHYRWLQENAPDPDVPVAPPPDFVFEAARSNPKPKLTPFHLDRTNFQYYTAKYGATGVLPPPDPQITINGSVLLNAESQPDDRDHPIQFVPHKTGKIEVTVPDKYHATRALASVSAHPALGRWRDQPDGSGDGYVGAWEAGGNATSLGYHVIKADFLLGGAQLSLYPISGASSVVGDVHRPVASIDSHKNYQEVWVTQQGEISRLSTGSFGTGKLEVGVIVGGTFEATASVTVICELMDSAFHTWQLETFDRIYEAYRTAQDAFREAQAAAKLQRDRGFAERSPARNAEIVREELKRQVIEMINRQTLRGYDLKDPLPDHPNQGPVTRLREAALAAPMIQFLEQAFEWNNMTYIMYPYYWANDAQWRKLQMIEGSDSNFVRFLRSGSARVIVPARPGYEFAVMYFSVYGEPWSGGPPPIPGDELYVSVAQEIQEMNGAPDDGEPGMLWEEKLPTTLVWLDPDSDLPHNEHRLLNGEPVVRICSE